MITKKEVKTTYSNKIIHAADIHWSPKHYLDIINPMKELISRIIQEKPLFVCLTGDYFDHKIEINDNPLYIEAIKYLFEISRHCKHLIILQGTYNHDYKTMETFYSTLEIFKKEFKNYFNNNINNIEGKEYNILDIENSYKNIYFFNQAKEINIEGFNFLMLPEEYPASPYDYYSPFIKEKEDNHFDFICGHGMINGCKMHDKVDNIKLKGFSFGIKDLERITKKIVLFGHIHIPQKLGSKIYYCGSLARTKYGEEHKKGFMQYTIDRDNNEHNIIDIEFVETITATKYLTFTNQDFEELSKEEIIKKMEDIKFIRFQGTKEDSKNEDLLELFKKAGKDLEDIKFILEKKDENEDINNIESNLLFKNIEEEPIKKQYLILLETDIKKTKSKKDREKLQNKKMLEKIEILNI
jgi:hypothetical protein